MSTREEPLSDQRSSIDKQTMGDTTGSQLHIYMYQVLRPAGSTKYWRLLPPEHVQTSYHHVPGTSPKHTTKDVNNSHRAARSIPATTIAFCLHLRTLAPARLCLQAAADHQENSGQKIAREISPARHIKPFPPVRVAPAIT